MNTLAIISNQPVDSNLFPFSNCIAFVALIISIASLWFSTLRPSKLIGMCNFFKTTSDPQKMILPCLWIKNAGAQTAFIEDIRICFQQNTSATESKRFSISPMIRDASSNNEHLFFNEGENKSGAIFEGFVIKRNETWHNIFSFGMPIEKEVDYDCLKGEWNVFVQVKRKTGDWVTVSGTEEKYIFKKNFFNEEKKLLQIFSPVKYSNREHFKWTC